MKKMLIFCALLFIFCMSSVLASEKQIETYITDQELLKIDKKITSLCSYDFCSELIKGSRITQLKDYRSKYLKYLDNTNRNLKDEVLLRGFVVTKITYE